MLVLVPIVPKIMELKSILWTCWSKSKIFNLIPTNSRGISFIIIQFLTAATNMFGQHCSTVLHCSGVQAHGLQYVVRECLFYAFFFSLVLLFVVQFLNFQCTCPRTTTLSQRHHFLPFCPRLASPPTEPAMPPLSPGWQRMRAGNGWRCFIDRYPVGATATWQQR